MAKQIKQTNNTNYSGGPLKPVAESYMSKINKPINTAINKAKQEVSNDASTPLKPKVKYKKKEFVFPNGKTMKEGIDGMYNQAKEQAAKNGVSFTPTYVEKPKVFDVKAGLNSAASVLAFTPGLGSLVKGAEFLGAAYKAAPLAMKFLTPALAGLGINAATGLNEDVNNMKSYKEYKKKQQSTNDYLQELQIKDLK